ncbi:60S ribosomal protein L4 [Myotis davidii]|uniref:60S ribosomal protein L4 n=1 Tax=Myotis davidii TaxID=225400 RepID=L5LK03_MYODS|nr:60S ribosomal protein L4 [Myotis davidii]
MGRVLWGSHVCTNQNLEPLAPQSEHNTEEIHICSAPAASALPALVMSKGHQVEEDSECPLVVEDKVEGYKKTKEAVMLLKKLRAWNDIKRSLSLVNESWQGQKRNHIRIQCRGLCIICKEDTGIIKTFRNIPGITLRDVSKLNILKLAPGGYVG